MAFSNGKLDVAVLVLALFLTGVTNAMQVTSSGPQTIQKAKGETVTLGCTFTSGAQDIGELDIEWSNLSPDMTQKDSLILSYTGGSMHYYGSWNIKDRLKFIADPKNGDASVSLSKLQPSDTATYQCKVKKAPGVDTRKVTLVVMEPPSNPKCWVEGSEEKGSPVSLRCKSQGSVPLTYSWTRETGGPMPTDATQDFSTGELLIKNHTDSYAGTYACVVKNAVGSGQCKYELHAYNPTNRVGMIVGAVIGALLLLLLLLLLLWLLICCCNKRRYEKEQANEVKEDAPAPESRPTSRATSVRSVLSYHTHHGVQYSSVSNPQTSVRESAPRAIYTGGSVRDSQRSNGGLKHTHSLQYDPKYGYAV